MKATIVDTISDRLTTWIGSTASLLVHTLLFAFAFLSHWIFGWHYDFILLVLTTVVSLEAIYFSIFIQRSVNQQALRLQEVEESIDDVEEALDDVEEALDDAEDDIAGIPADTLKQLQEPIADITSQMQVLLKELQTVTKAARVKAKKEK